MDLKILNTRSEELGFNFTVEQQMTSGIQALIQEVVIELLSDFNSVYARGAGLTQVVAASDPGNESSTRSSIALSVQNAKTHILANQRDAGDLLAAERLVDLILLSATTEGGVEWIIDLQLVSAAGETIETSITV